VIGVSLLYYVGGTLVGIDPASSDVLVSGWCVPYPFVSAIMVYPDLELRHIVLYLKALYETNTRIEGNEVIAFLVFAVSTNILVTGLIIFRLLRARWNLTKVLPSADVQVYTGVIAILVESAAPLTIFGIISIIQLNWPSPARTPGFYVCNYLFQALFLSFCVSASHQLQKQAFIDFFTQRRSLHT
jgi:hypothetical protein